MFGYNGRKTDEGYYITYELCHDDDQTPLYSADLVKEDWNYMYSEMDGEFAGNYTQFVFEVGEGEDLYIVEAGQYSVNVYISKESGEWQLADTFSFRVSE